MSNRIGRVSVSEKCPSTCDEFTFWVETEKIIKPFDIIKVSHIQNSTTYAIIKDIFYVTDSASHMSNYISSDFGDLDCTPQTLRLGLTYATVEVLSNNEDIYMPLRDGQIVEFASETEIKEALGLNNINNEVPAGFIHMSNGLNVPIGFDSDFLIGPEGAHLNISGISGLATKTSYAMFLLQAVQQKTEDTAVIILNVKGADLLTIDEENKELTSSEKEQWKKCSLECKPFENVKYFYPFNNVADSFYSDTWNGIGALKEQHADDKAFNYIYTYNHDKDKLGLLFSNIDDSSMTMDSILSKLDQEKVFDNLTWNEFLVEVGNRSQRGNSNDIAVQSWRKFFRLVNSAIKSNIDSGIFQSGRSPKVERKQVYLSEQIKRIKGGEVHVVDIAKLEEQHQCMVFGDIIQSVYDLKLGGRDDQGGIPKRIVIFVDELNKYAPSNSPKDSPILKYLLEITERGRSLGIILFSAEQFKSAIHDRVKGNCSSHVYGRTNATEIAKSDYKYIPKTYTNMMTRLQKGDLIIQHPIFRTLLKVTFPKPSYNQRKEKMTK